jgi:hypothetical protein
MEEVNFGVTGIPWNVGSRYWLDLNGLGIEEVNFIPTQIARNGGS